MPIIVVSVVQPDRNSKLGYIYSPLAWLGTVRSVASAEQLIAGLSARKDLKRGMLIAATEDDEWGRAVAFGRVAAATSKGAKIAMVRDGKMVDQNGAEMPASALGVGGVGRMCRSVGLTARGPIGLYSRTPVDTWLKAEDAVKMARRAGAFDVRQKSLLEAAVAITSLGITSVSRLRCARDNEKAISGLQLATEATSETRRWLNGQNIKSDEIEALLRRVSDAEDDLVPNALTNPDNSIKRIQKVVGAAWLTGSAILNKDSAGYTLSEVVSHVNQSGYASPRSLSDIIRDHISAAEIVLSIACSNQLTPTE